MSLAQCPGFLFAHREECTVEIKKIINPRYTESGAVDCDVFFDDRDQAVPYTATADDVAPTGQRIWQELQSGKWGEIAPFTVTPEMLEAAREARRQEIEAWRTEQEAKPFTFEWNGRIWNAGPNSLGRLSPVVMLAKSVTAQTALNQWPALTYYADDGWAEADNNIAENALRMVSLGRKNYLFFGSDHGGERGALLYSLIGTCKLNGVEPESYLRYVLDVIADWPINRVGELLPWRVALPTE
ncbi:prophage tail protein [Shigella sonnei]|nr:prophage tail protein [Shigella sonnei]